MPNAALDRPRVVPFFKKATKYRFIHSSSETRKKPGEKNGPTRSWGPENLAPRISRGHFLFAGFLRISLDGLGERGTTRSLALEDYFLSDFSHKLCNYDVTMFAMYTIKKTGVLRLDHRYRDTTSLQ